MRLSKLQILSDTGPKPHNNGPKPHKLLDLKMEHQKPRIFVTYKGLEVV